MKALKSLFYVLSIFSLISCGDSEEEGEDAEAVEEVVVVSKIVTFEGALKISNSEFMVNDQPAVLLTVGHPDDRRLELSLSKENIQEDYSVITEANNDPSIIIEAYWEELLYTQSTTHETHVNFTITALDDVNLIASIKLSASLVNPDTDEILIINESNLEIGGKNFLLLTGGEMPE